MITILVVDDEHKVYKLLSQALSKEGYSVFNEPASKGAIKIVKKVNFPDEAAPSNGFLDLTDTLLKDKDGQIYKTLLEEVEKPLIESVLKKTEGNKFKAAKMLGINRNTLNAKIKKLGIDSEKFKRY